MQVKSISLTNYRNYENLFLDFDEKLNVLIGKNAQGKTNLLEAIFFCAIGKSLRAIREKEVVFHGKNIAKISVIVQKKFGTSKIEIVFSSANKKTIKINDIPIKRIGELFGEIGVVMFSPSELKLVQESPDDRRRFMDIAISQISKNYFYLLTRYEKILANRNKLLKSDYPKNDILDTIGIWNESLARCGSKIEYSRQKFIENIATFAKLAHEFLTSGEEALSVSLAGASSFATVDEIYCDLIKNLEKNFEKDYKLGFTTTGVHRDDIKLFVNDIDIKTFGSQGQQRTVALSLKLAELEILKEKLGETPILLLDDVFSELDSTRRAKLLKFTEKAQTFITCNEFLQKVNGSVFEIQKGKAIKQA